MNGGGIGKNMTSGYSAKHDIAKIQEAEMFYASFLAYTESLFNDLIKTNQLDSNSIFERVRMVYESICYDRRYILRVQYLADPKGYENYLISHTVRTTIIALIIGINMKLPVHRLLELGVSALLHDIGMFSLPQNLYLDSRIFTDQEKKLLRTHPVQGYKCLTQNNFPLSVKEGVIEHHERENGSGYPRNLKGVNISLYGKIITVACSYEAISAKRLHKESKDYHTGIMELVDRKSVV